MEMANRHHASSGAFVIHPSCHALTDTPMLTCREYGQASPTPALPGPHMCRCSAPRQRLQGRPTQVVTVPAMLQHERWPVCVRTGGRGRGSGGGLGGWGGGAHKPMDGGQRPAGGPEGHIAARRGT